MNAWSRTNDGNDTQENESRFACDSFTCDPWSNICGAIRCFAAREQADGDCGFYSKAANVEVVANAGWDIDPWRRSASDCLSTRKGKDTRR